METRGVVLGGGVALPADVKAVGKAVGGGADVGYAMEGTRRNEAPGTGQTGFWQVEAMLGRQVGKENHATVADDHRCHEAMLMPKHAEHVLRERPRIAGARGAMEVAPQAAEMRG